MSLSRDELLGVLDAKVIEVPVAAWGGTVFLRSMTGADRAAFESGMQSVPEGSQRAWKCISSVLLRCLCDKDGVRLLTDDDEQLLMGKDYRALADLAKEALDLNKLSESSLEETEKNS